jgi:hypothetical protein
MGRAASTPDSPPGRCRASDDTHAERRLIGGAAERLDWPQAGEGAGSRDYAERMRDWARAFSERMLARSATDAGCGFTAATRAGAAAARRAPPAAPPASGRG